MPFLPSRRGEKNKNMENGKTENFMQKSAEENIDLTDHNKEPRSKQKFNAENSIKKGETHKRIKVQFDIGYKTHPGKTMDGNSMTVPDMSLTIRQLLEDHTRGKTNEVQIKKPVYFEVEIPQIRDITDVQSFQKQLESQLKHVKQFIADDIQNASDERKQEAIQKQQEQMFKEGDHLIRKQEAIQKQQEQMFKEGDHLIKE